MAVKFNPFTGQLQIDEKGSGGGSSYIDGEVQNFSALPETLGSPAVDSAYLVREAEGAWLLNRKPAGIYIRTANTGTRASDWTYAGEFPDVFSDANFVLYDNGDSTKNLQFQLSAIATGTTRTITVPDKNLTLDDAGDSRTPTAHAASHASAGSDPLFDQDLNTTDSPTFASLTIDTLGSVDFSAAQNIQLAPIYSQLQIKDVASENLGSFRAEADSLTANRTYDLPDASGTLALVGDAPASHTHAASDITSGSFGNISHDGKVGSTAGLPVVTTTAGAVTTLALGTANQILRVNSGASGVEFADPAGGGVTGAASSASDVLGVSGSNITGVDANADRIIFWDDSASALKHLTVGSGLSLTDTTLTATATGTIGGSTGATDNAVLRADGTGGSTSQGSAFVIADNATASPNNTVNHASIQATGDTTNVSVSIVPKGTGAFMLRVPDSASTGGNSRGVNAVDLMLERLAANQVASGEASFAAGARHIVSGLRAAAVGGYGSTASASNAVTLGALNTATGETAGSLCGYSNDATASEAVVVGGNSNDATAARSSVIGGNNNIASADSSICVGGQRATANRFCIHAHAAGQFAAGGDAQRIRAVLRCKTTTNAAVEMALDGSTTYLTIPSGKVIYAEIRVVGTKSDGSAVACFTRQYAAKNVAGTSSEVFAPVTIGTDTAAGTSLEVAAVDAGDYIRIRPTGIASETWRWVASVDAVEVAYGS